MAKIHRHRAIPAKREITGFMAPVAWPENPAAHGCVTYHDVCSCGATRATNVNQRHVERGEWKETEQA